MGVGRSHAHCVGCVLGSAHTPLLRASAGSDPTGRAQSGRSVTITTIPNAHTHAHAHRHAQEKVVFIFIFGDGLYFFFFQKIKRIPDKTNKQIWKNQMSVWRCWLVGATEPGDVGRVVLLQLTESCQHTCTHARAVYLHRQMQRTGDASTCLSTRTNVRN